MPDLSPEEMARIHAACFTTPRPWSAPEIAALLQSPHVFALTESGGFLLGRVVVDEAELLTLAVSPDHRRCGIGARLVRAFLDTARNRGATTAFLEVSAENEAAITLYAQAGFAQTALRRAYYTAPERHPVDACIMARAL